MIQAKAYELASIRAKGALAERFVVFDCDTYQVGDDFDLETRFAGAEVVATFGPDGQLVRE